jgi:hypothetical protein
MIGNKSKTGISQINPNSLANLTKGKRYKKGEPSQRKGKKYPSPSKLTIEKMRLAHKGKHSGKNSNFWKRGVCPEHIKQRNSIQNRLWREAVFARDNWTCQKYDIKGCELHPHHILNFAQYPELRFSIDNGITLSSKAHKEFHKKYGTKNNSREQLLEFLNKNIC